MRLKGNGSKKNILKEQGKCRIGAQKESRRGRQTHTKDRDWGHDACVAEIKSGQVVARSFGGVSKRIPSRPGLEHHRKNNTCEKLKSKVEREEVEPNIARGEHPKWRAHKVTVKGDKTKNTLHWRWKPGVCCKQ